MTTAAPSTPVEHDLLRRAAALAADIDVIDTQIVPTVGNDDWHVRIKLRVDQDAIEAGAVALIYAIGLLSFLDARPRGETAQGFDDEDRFTSADMIWRLRFEQGRLCMYVDYLRGRCVKTTVEVASNGNVLLETTHRGQAATRWVERLRGKPLLEPVRPT